MDFRSAYLPYCLIRQPDGRYAVVNRRYKPLGFMTNEWVDYEQFPVLVKFKRLTEKTAAALDCEGRTGLDRIYLYNDGSVPTRSAANMRTYLDRLAKLAELEIE